MLVINAGAVCHVACVRRLLTPPKRRCPQIGRLVILKSVNLRGINNLAIYGVILGKSTITYEMCVHQILQFQSIKVGYVFFCLGKCDTGNEFNSDIST